MCNWENKERAMFTDLVLTVQVRKTSIIFCSVGLRSREHARSHERRPYMYVYLDSFNRLMIRDVGIS